MIKTQSRNLQFMQGTIALFIIALFISFNVSAQTTFWSDNFDAPSGGANNNNNGVGWTFLNTPGGGQNTDEFGFTNGWEIGSSGGCVSGNSMYVSNDLTDDNSYISDVNSDILASSADISTVGVTAITLKFTWRDNGSGSSNLDYGSVGLSSDGGATWTWLPTHYIGQTSCQQATITVANTYEGKTNFRIGFRYLSNSTSCSSCDPPFNVDNIQLIGTVAGACTPPTVDAGSAKTICDGDNTTIGGAPTATGTPNGPFSYAWSPATLNSTTTANPVANPSVTTTYTVVVTDNPTGCTASNTVVVTVTQGGGTPGTVTSAKNTICQNTIAHLSVSGNSGPVQWQSSTDSLTGFVDISGATNTTYASNALAHNTFFRVVVGGGNCGVPSVSYQVYVLPAPLAVFSSNVNGQVVSFDASGSTGATSYFWDFGDDSTSTLVNPVHTFGAIKTYHVCLTVKNNSNCNFTLCQNVTTFPTGVDDIDGSSVWQVYPDPFGSQLYIGISNANTIVKSIEMYDVLGRRVFEKDIAGQMENPIKLDMSEIRAGVYYLKIKTRDSEYIKSVIKQ